MFLFNINGFGFKNPSWKTTICEKGGLQPNGCFINLWFANCEKLSFFAPFLAKFWVMFKNPLKYEFQHILKAKNSKNMAILNGY